MQMRQANTILDDTCLPQMTDFHNEVRLTRADVEERRPGAHRRRALLHCLRPERGDHQPLRDPPGRLARSARADRSVLIGRCFDSKGRALVLTAANDGNWSVAA